MLTSIANWVAASEIATLRQKLREAEYERDSLAVKLAVKEDELEAMAHAFEAVRQRLMNVHAAMVQEGRAIGGDHKK